MKDKEHSLLYHTMHSRPMPGCLPLFFILAMIVAGVGIWLSPVEMPERVRPRGVGKVYIKNDRLTNFVLGRQSPLPLHLPLHADPEYQEDVAAASMPLLRPVKLMPAPPQPVFNTAADSAVLNEASLLELPKTVEPVSEPEPQVVEPPQPADSAAETAVQQSSAELPVFHPGVEKENQQGEEVQP